MVILMIRLCKSKRIYMSTEEAMPVPSESNRVTPDWNLEEFLSSNKSGQMTGLRGTIGIDIQQYLSLLPELRGDKQIKRILSMVRGIDAFSIFSSDMNEELGRRLMYERYDNGRLIAYQGRPPERLYYIISGKVTQLRQYDLATGNFIKCVGILTKGQFTETEELDRCSDRKHNLVCKGSVEVLLLERKDYFFLLNTHNGPPVEFLRTHVLFEDFPCELFIQHPETTECKYYGPNKIVAADANDTKDIFIIKSGRCRCTRKQYVLDVKSNKAFSDKKTIDKIGYVKPSSRADAMLGTFMKRSVERGMTRFNHRESAFVRHKDLSSSNSHLELINSDDTTEYQVGGRKTGIGTKSIEYLNCITRKDEKGSLKESDLIQRQFGRPRRVSLAFAMQSELLPPSLAMVNMQEQDIDAYGDYDDIRNNRRRSVHRQKSLSHDSLEQRDTTMLKNKQYHKKHHSFDDKKERKLVYLGLETLSPSDMFGFNDLSVTAVPGPSSVCVIRDFTDEDKANYQLVHQEMWTRYKEALINKMATSSRRDRTGDDS